MSRTIIKIQSDLQGKIRFSLDIAPQPPWPIRDAAKLRSLALPKTANPISNMSKGVLVPEVVREAGMLLFKKLSAHPAIKTAIESALSHQSSCPIYIYLESDIAETWPWEILCDPTTGEFLSLGQWWPVGRIVNSHAMASERAVEPPIRITAILAVAGYSARPEWEALYRALYTTSVAVRLQVFVCEDALKQEIESLKPHPNVAIEAVNFISRQQNMLDLFDAINGFMPNILHFFCHGSATPIPHLELASRADYWETSGSIHIYASQLRQLLQHHIWLVTMNSCEGAAPTPSFYAIARDLVASGFPAAVGMREGIASIDAHVFCGAFYRSLCEYISSFLPYKKIGVKVEWSKLMYKPRMQLLNQHIGGRPPAKADGESKEWTLPVIYVRSGDMILRGPSTNQLLTPLEKLSLHAQLDTLKEKWLDPPDTPEMLQSLMSRIVQVENELYPPPGLITTIPF